MAEHPNFESPVNGRYPTAIGAALALGDESALTKLVIRAADDTSAARQLAVTFGSSRTVDDVTILGQRPNEWLVVGDEPSVTSFAGTLDRTGHVSTIDHTHARALFRLTGEAGPSLLAKVCGLDWDDRFTPDGAVTSASVARVNCDIVRCDLAQDADLAQDQGRARSYRLACDRSFGQYLFDALLDAGREFGIGVAPAP